MKFTVGSVCSGIEAASVAWLPLGMEFKWFSEIAEFPSEILRTKYPDIPNLGDMSLLSEKLGNNEIVAPDIICGGTPCQAFSFAGFQKGLDDDRGNLTLKFVEIVNANDKTRQAQGKKSTIVFWENVEGVLTDKTNAFGCFISSLAGLQEPLKQSKWPSSGIVYGTNRNIAWRVIDAKYFGLPQQRKRLYVLAGGTDFHPENILFERKTHDPIPFPNYGLTFEKDGCEFEVFREYTDCLYAAYGTKWNGNAAATNGSLFVVQNNRIRRLSPLETERLMGFPDNYTALPNSKKTSRYQATGNSWAVPVVKWIGSRLVGENLNDLHLSKEILSDSKCKVLKSSETVCYLLGKEYFSLSNIIINCTPIPENCAFGNMRDIVSTNAHEDIYISPIGCYGIIRRVRERNSKINERLKEVLLNISSNMSIEEIEKKSKTQKRGKYSI